MNKKGCVKVFSFQLLLIKYSLAIYKYSKPLKNSLTIWNKQAYLCFSSIGNQPYGMHKICRVGYSFIWSYISPMASASATLHSRKKCNYKKTTIKIVYEKMTVPIRKSLKFLERNMKDFFSFSVCISREEWFNAIFCTFYIQLI